MLPELDTLDKLPEPFEILELHDGETRVIRPESYTLGKAMINPRDGRPSKEIPILRVHVSEAAKPTLPQWWDITSKHLTAGLLAQLETRGPPFPEFVVTKHGTGPSARFSLAVRPV